jgi:hypothetical protein
MSGLEVISAVVCDEVRREASGDAIIIGAKQNGPAVLEDAQALRDPIAFYIELESDYPPPERISVRLRNAASGDVVFEHNFRGGDDVPKDIDSDTNIRGVLVMVINQRTSPVSEAGMYILECSGGGEKWLRLREIDFPSRK